MWIDYPTDASNYLAQCYDIGTQTCKIKLEVDEKPLTYTIDLKNMTQKTDDSGTTRPIRKPYERRRGSTASKASAGTSISKASATKPPSWEISENFVLEIVVWTSEDDERVLVELEDHKRKKAEKLAEKLAEKQQEPLDRITENSARDSKKSDRDSKKSERDTGGRESKKSDGESKLSSEEIVIDSKREIVEEKEEESVESQSKAEIVLKGEEEISVKTPKEASAKSLSKRAISFDDFSPTELSKREETSLKTEEVDAISPTKSLSRREILLEKVEEASPAATPVWLQNMMDLEPVSGEDDAPTIYEVVTWTEEDDARVLIALEEKRRQKEEKLAADNKQDAALRTSILTNAPEVPETMESPVNSSGGTNPNYSWENSDGWRTSAGQSAGGSESAGAFFSSTTALSDIPEEGEGDSSIRTVIE